MANIKKSEAMTALRRLKQFARNLEVSDLETAKFDKWHRDVQVAIQHIFGKDTRNMKDFVNISYEPEEEYASTNQEHDAFEDGMEFAEATIQSMIDEIRQFWPNEESVSIVRVDSQQHNEGMGNPRSKRVFIVHGHDETMKEPVARVITQLGFEPVILHEQPNKGRTIIEKFTDYAEVSFALVLLSPDDRAYPIGKSNSQAKTRARQNVVLELGYFLGKLGRERVLPLYRGDQDFEMPSDYTGVVYTQFDDAGAWRIRLVKELRSCGFTVDANKLV